MNEKMLTQILENQKAIMSLLITHNKDWGDEVGTAIEDTQKLLTEFYWTR